VATSIEATMILADGAQVADGKLYVLGGGWTRLKPHIPVRQSLGIVVHVPFDLTNHPLKLHVQLLDDDSNTVGLGGNEVKVDVEFEVGRPPGVKHGETINFPLALDFDGLALEPGGYVWQSEVDGESVARWPFRVV
jgi:hypothetical protein